MHLKKTERPLSSVSYLLDTPVYHNIITAIFPTFLLLAGIFAVATTRKLLRFLFLCVCHSLKPIIFKINTDNT